MAKRGFDAPTLLLLGATMGLIVLGCRTGDVLAQRAATPTRPATRIIPRPTFTAEPPTLELPPTPAPAPTRALIVATRAPTPRPAPTRVPTARQPAPTAAAPTPIPPPPTDDPNAGFYYRITRNVCGRGENTRIQGSVQGEGAPLDGIRVRVSFELNGPPVINDSITGVDPVDPKHHDPSLTGHYRLGLYEGQLKGGSWFVFIVGDGGDALSAGAYVQTTEGPGCNTAMVDFAH